MKLSQVKVTRRDAVVGGVVAAAAIAGGVAFGVSQAAGGDGSGASVSGDAAGGDGTGDGAQDDAVEGGIVEPAGKMTLYTSCADTLVNAFVTGFQEKTRIAVDVWMMTCAEWQAALAADVARGVATADVVWGGDRSCYEGLAGLASPQKVCREACAIVLSRELGEKVRAGITGYATLAAAGLAGQVCMADPAADEDGFLQMVGLLCAGDKVAAAAGQLGTDAQWAYVQGFTASCGLKTLASGADVQDALIDGTAVAALMSEQQAYELAKLTSMVDVVLPQEGSLMVPTYMARVGGCTNADQVAAWFDYVCGEQGQKAAAQATYLRPVEEGTVLHEGMTADDDLAALAVPDDALVSSRQVLLATWPQALAGTWTPAAAEGAAGEAATE